MILTVTEHKDMYNVQFTMYNLSRRLNSSSLSEGTSKAKAT